MIVCEMKQSKLVVGLLLSGRVRKRRHGQVVAVSKRERERDDTDMEPLLTQRLASTCDALAQVPKIQVK